MKKFNNCNHNLPDDAFTDEEVCLLMAELEDNGTGHSIRLMLYTGLRVLELLALTPDDIAQDGSSVHVTKAACMVDGVPQFGPLKTKSSRRTIPVPEDARASALFLREHGVGLSQAGTFYRRYRQAFKEVSEVRNLPPHACRHTYINRLRASGISEDLLEQLLGHAPTHDEFHASARALAEAVTVLNEKKEVSE